MTDSFNSVMARRWINTTPHAITFYHAGGDARIMTIPSIKAAAIRLVAATQKVVSTDPSTGFQVVEKPRFVDLETSYVPSPGDWLLVSALAALYIRESCREYDEVHIYAPETDNLVVRNEDKMIIGCRGLVVYPPPSKTE